MKNKPMRIRMIVDLPLEIQMAIKLRSVKNGVTTGAVVMEAVEKMFPADVIEAKAALKDAKK